MTSVHHDASTDIRTVARAALSARLALHLNREVPGVDALARVLSAYTETPFAPDATPKASCGRSASAAFKLLGGVTGTELVAQHTRLTRTAALDRLGRRPASVAAYSDDVLDAFLPGALLAVEQIIDDGPSVAVGRVYDALEAIVRTPKHPGVRLGTPGMAPGYVARLASDTRSLMRTLVELNTQLGGAAPEAIRQWTALPPMSLPETSGTTVEVEAPPLEDVRLAFQEATGRIRDDTGAHSLEEELSWAETAPPQELVPLWRPMETRLRLALFVVLGGRARAMRRLCLNSFEPVYEGPRPDYYRGAALVTEPGKTRSAKGRKRPKGCDDELALLLRTFITLRRRAWRGALDGDVTYSRQEGRKSDPLGVIRAAGAELPDTAALFSPSLWSAAPVSYTSIRARFVGRVPTRIIIRAPGHQRGRWGVPAGRHTRNRSSGAPATSLHQRWRRTTPRCGTRSAPRASRRSRSTRRPTSSPSTRASSHTSIAI